MKEIFKYLLLLCLVACNDTGSLNDTFTARVVAIDDGDTIEVLFNGQKERVRFEGVDCPEKAQAFGTRARQFTASLCFGKQVKVVSKGKRDRYHRIIGTVFAGDVDVNKELLKAGMAWHYKTYSQNAEYAELENAARENRVGLWSDENPVPPWEYRKDKRRKTQVREEVYL